MPIPLSEWIPVALGLHGKERYDAWQALHAKYVTGDLHAASIAGCVRKVFLLEHCADSLTQLERERLEWAQAEGADISVAAAEDYVHEYGLNGHLPHWLAHLSARECLYIDLWTMRELAPKYGTPEVDYGKEAEDWITYFSLQVAERKAGRPESVVRSYKQWVEQGRQFVIKHSSPRTPEAPHPAEEEAPL